MMGQEIWLDVFAERVEVGGDDCQRYEDVTGHALAVDRFQAKLIGIDGSSHLPCGRETAIQMIGPLVIGADEPLSHLAMLCATDARSTMPARVVNGADCAVLTA